MVSYRKWNTSLLASKIDLFSDFLSTVFSKCKWFCYSFGLEIKTRRIEKSINWKIFYLIVEANIHEITMHIRSKKIRTNQMRKTQCIQFFQSQEFIIIINYTKKNMTIVERQISPNLYPRVSLPILP